MYANEGIFHLIISYLHIQTPFQKTYKLLSQFTLINQLGNYSDIC